MRETMIDNPAITECIEIVPGQYRTRRADGMWSEIYADDEDAIRGLCGIPFEVVLPWGTCEVCGARFLDWDDDGMCGPCERKAETYAERPEWFRGE